MTNDYFATSAGDLDEDVIAVVSALRSLFDEPALAEIGPDRTSVLSEGQHGADLVIQHPTVAGLSLVVGVGAGRADLYFAQVTSLDRKDELDVARQFRQASVRLDEAGPQAVAVAVREQLQAELHVVESSQFGKRLATEIRASTPDDRAEEHRIWRRNERRVAVPLVPRSCQSRRASFLSLI